MSLPEPVLGGRARDAGRAGDIGRAAQEVQLHVELVMFRDRDQSHVDQHLRPALVQLRDQVGDPLLVPLVRVDDQRIGVRIGNDLDLLILVHDHLLDLATLFLLLDRFLNQVLKQLGQMLGRGVLQRIDLIRNLVGECFTIDVLDDMRDLRVLFIGGVHQEGIRRLHHDHLRLLHQSLFRHFGRRRDLGLRRRAGSPAGAGPATAAS